MGYYVVAVFATVLGFLLGTSLSQAGNDDRRCINCRHHREILDDVPDWLGKDHVACAACRGVDYELPEMIQPVSLTKPEAFCNEFQPMEGEGG